MLIDTHAHLNDLEAYPDYNEVVQALSSNNIKSVIVVGSNFESSMIGCSQTKHSSIYASVGTHPSYASEFCKEHEQEYLKALAHERVVAVGEAGLDYHYDGFDKALQRRVFEQHIELANKASVPLIVHIRDAYEDALAILKCGIGLLKHGALLHCFSGSVEYMEQVLAIGLEIAIGGAVTFKNARKLLDVAREVPLDRLHLETDCPYLCPDRGKRNEPKYVNAVAQRIAEVKGIDLQEVEHATVQNAKRLFKVD